MARRVILLVALTLVLVACSEPVTPDEIDAAASSLIEPKEGMTPRQQDEAAAWIIRALYNGDYGSPYELPSGRTVAWTAERVLDGIWYLPSTVGKTTTLIPQYDYDWQCSLTVYDEFGREKFYRELWVE